MAERFKDEPEFYFPHMLDFRGRMYPIPSDLSPQGEDLHRGLLTFANPKPLTKTGAAWLAVHLANVHGIDKVSFEERIQWVMEREARWRSIAEDPLGNRVWADEDDAWQCLAAIFEWVRWLDEGEGMLSSLPVRVDGTCNGIQHLSAMVLDEVGGASVNLIPSETPRDIYQEVADILTDLLFTKLPNPQAKLWLDLFDGRAPRSVTKRPVMILPYGGTRHAYFGYTMEWLNEKDPTGEIVPFGKPRSELVSFLVPLLWKSVGKSVEKARGVMEWLQECAKVAASRGLPLWWKTPTGFYVRQFYGKLKETQVNTLIDGQRIKLANWIHTPDLNVDEQLMAIAPNFVHSMDASALMQCVLLAEANGIESITSIHDAYGTVAEDIEVLNACIRQAFIDTYSVPVLGEFRMACYAVAGSGVKMPRLPRSGKLKLEQVSDATYFFA